MSAVDEMIVREFFESHGFLLCQRRKYALPARRNPAEDETCIVVSNPRFKPTEAELDFEVTADSLRNISRAIVAVKGWHTERFAPGVLAHQPRIFRFVEKKALEEAHRLVGAEGLRKILVMPGLSKDEKLRTKSIEVLRSRGVDGVLSFETILSDLIGQVAVNRNYQKSDLLQILRLLKNYGLLRDPQMELKLRPRK
jgi:hypothetical protein